jgi:hypothetical protein
MTTEATEQNRRTQRKKGKQKREKGRRNSTAKLDHALRSEESWLRAGRAQSKSGGHRGRAIILRRASRNQWERNVFINRLVASRGLS